MMQAKKSINHLCDDFDLKLDFLYSVISVVIYTAIVA